MNQLKAGAVLNYVVILLNTLVGLLYTPYMLRMMGQSEYGLYSLVASVIAYLTILDLGSLLSDKNFLEKVRGQI
jgi:O-antigen/teichoic acid export membrane protein